MKTLIAILQEAGVPASTSKFPIRPTWNLSLRPWTSPSRWGFRLSLPVITANRMALQCATPKCVSRLAMLAVCTLIPSCGETITSPWSSSPAPSSATTTFRFWSCIASRKVRCHVGHQPAIAGGS